MAHYMTYGPYLCIGAVLVFLFVIWAFFGGKSYDFVGLAPLDPNTCSKYTGSIYEWGKDDLICPREENIPEESICINPNMSNIIPETSKPVTMAIPCKKTKKIPTKGERICCKTMERIYGVPFVNTRPDWLENPETGANIELDCYNEELQLAVEYNGVHHYIWPNWTGQSYEEFISQVRRDKLKLDLCDRNGVYLIVVPYNIPFDEIPQYITSYLPETLRKRIESEQTLFTIE